MDWKSGVISGWRVQTPEPIQGKSWSAGMKDRPTRMTVRGPVGTTRPNSKVLPGGFSWLSVPIPREVHAHVRHMAGLSNMSLKEYVAWFLRTAHPRNEVDMSQDTPDLNTQ